MRPIVSHKTITSKCSGSKPTPVSSGLYEECSANAKCRTGKILATVVSHAGAFCSGTNTSDMNKSGRIDALTMAGDESPLGMTVVIDNPRTEKVAAPIMSVNRNDGSALLGKCTSYRRTPNPVTMATNRVASSTEWIILANRNDHTGIGVLWIRLSRP